MKSKSYETGGSLLGKNRLTPEKRVQTPYYVSRTPYYHPLAPEKVTRTPIKQSITPYCCVRRCIDSMKRKSHETGGSLLGKNRLTPEKRVQTPYYHPLAPEKVLKSPEKQKISPHYQESTKARSTHSRSFT